MQAFHGKQEVKEFYLARVRAHRAADEIAQGVYYEKVGNRVQAGAVGCVLHSGDHEAYETELGIPQVLAHLQDAIFEGLPIEEAREFPLQFLTAIKVGADLSQIWPRFVIWQLTDETHGARQYADDQGKAAIDLVVLLYERMLAGEDIHTDEFRSAAAAAWSARSAAAAKENFWRAARDEMLRLLKATEVEKV